MKNDASGSESQLACEGRAHQCSPVAKCNTADAWKRQLGPEARLGQGKKGE